MNEVQYCFFINDKIDLINNKHMYCQSFQTIQEITMDRVCGINVFLPEPFYSDRGYSS